MARPAASVVAVLGVLISSVAPAGADGSGSCRESNALFRSYPGRARFYGEGLAIDAGPEVVGCFMHRKHTRLWPAPFAMVAAWPVQGVVSNLRCAGAQH